MVRGSRYLFTVLLVVVVASACSTATSTPSPTAASATATPAAGSPSAAPASASATAAASASATAAASASATAPAGSASPAATIVATIPSDLLEFPGKLVICSDLPYPPQEYFDESGNPIGSDIEIGEEIARRLGLEAQIENSVFDTIIPALTGGKCDVIISAQNITPERLAAVDMIPFFQAGQAFLVQAGNPSNINTAEDLCGKKVAAESGTTMLDYIGGQGLFTTTGLPSICSAAGKPAPEPQSYPKDTDALQALQAGTADAYMADLPVVIGYADAQPQSFMLAPVPQIDPALEGISVGKSTTAGQQYTPIYDAMKTALISMINDGTYLNILSKYKVDGGAITVDQVNGPLPSPAPSVSPSPTT